jgi:hypothetical protein
MSTKQHNPELIVTMLRQFQVLVGQWMPRIDANLQVSIYTQSYYCWRKQYGEMGTDRLKELNRLLKEYDRLRKAVPDPTLAGRDG